MDSKLLTLFKSLDSDFDGILISDSSLLHYYTGIKNIEGTILVLKKEVFLFVDFRYFEIAKLNASCFFVVLYSNLKDELAKIFNDYKVNKVAVVSEGLLACNFLNFNSYFKNTNFFLNEKLDYFVGMQTALKNTLEIEKIACAQQISQNVLKDVLNFIRPGVSEIEIAREINSLICKRSDGVAFETIVVSGKRTSLPHGVATDKLLEIGDFVTLDFGAIVDGYRSDMTRTICLGNPSSLQKEVYELVLNAQKLALEKIELGVKCSLVDALVRKYFAEYGYSEKFGHSLGHGVGLKIHELPNISSNSLEKFENGMVFTVEPGLYFENMFGVRIEDLVLMDDGKVVNLTDFDKNLICL